MGIPIPSPTPTVELGCGNEKNNEIRGGKIAKTANDLAVGLP